MSPTDNPPQPARPTKKQRELLNFIESFIHEHGYSPSYREIKTGCGYNSIATVAVHINNLITRGHLKKRDRSARSLEVVSPNDADKPLATNQVSPRDEKWLIEKIDYFMQQAEQTSQLSSDQVSDINSLLEALRILGLEAAAQSFRSRLAKLKARSPASPSDS